MSTFLLTWNPAEWPGDHWGDDVERSASGKTVSFCWSCGNNKRIQVKDRVFLLRQGTDHPGMLGSGQVVEASYKDEHWNPKKARRGLKAWYVKVKWDSLLLPKEGLPRSELLKGVLRETLVNSQASGVIIEPGEAEKLENRWGGNWRGLHYSARKFLSSVSAWEGDRVECRAYRLKRDRKLMQAARNAAKGVCAACEVNYANILNGKGVRVLQVHHKHQLGQLDTPKLNSIDDLAVVCANCHALIHANPNKALEVETLKSMLHMPN